MLTLTTGANAPIEDAVVDITVSWPIGRGTLDCSAYLLGENGRVRDDADMVFYNQPSDPANAALMENSPGISRLRVELARVPAAVSRIAMCATIEGTAVTMRDFAGLAATLEGAGGERRLRFAPELDAHRSLRVVELYRHNGRWKLRAVGQGFAAGLAKLAGEYGVAVDEGAAAPTSPSAPVPSPPRPVPPEDAPPPQGAEGAGSSKGRWNMDAVRNGLADGLNRLAGAFGGDAPGSTALPATSHEPVDFGQTRPSPPAPKPPPADVLGPGRPNLPWPEMPGGPVSISLDWSSRRGGLDGRPRALDLALGCFVELADGTRCIVQGGGGLAVGGEPALVRLAAAVAAATDAGGGQTLTLDGARLPELNALTIYAVIASGAPNWRAATVTLRIAVAGRLPVLLPLSPGEDGDGCGVVAIARLSRASKGLDITRLARFAWREPDLDAALGWDMTWQP